MHYLKALPMTKTNATMSLTTMASSPALAKPPSQDNYIIRFCRRKSQCVFLIIMLLISLLSVLQIFITKLDDKLVTSLTTALITVLKESDMLNTTHLFADENVFE